MKIGALWFCHSAASRAKSVSPPERRSPGYSNWPVQPGWGFSHWAGSGRRVRMQRAPAQVRRMLALPMTRDPSQQTGRRFGDYRVVRLLARGGMGSVYEAEHVPSGRVLALKLPDASMSNDETALRRFRAEGRLVDTVRHPNIVRVFEVGVEEDCPFIVMELLRGETLRAKVARQGVLSQGDVLELFIPISGAVAALHDAGIVHRDLKLCNIMLTERSGTLVPMILDFGISKDLVAAGSSHTQLTQSGAFVGTP